jgi:hypothetical protein
VVDRLRVELRVVDELVDAVEGDACLEPIQQISFLP